MNVLILHNLYQQAGGEDGVVRNEAELLAKAGHRVTVETVDNHAIDGVREKVRVAMRMAYDPARATWTQALLERVQPDLVHVHNFFPLLTAAVHETARRAAVPVVQTLHNYRLFCAAGTFERDGEICELCLHGGRRHAVRYRCYRNSLPGSAALVGMQRILVDRGRLIDNVDRFVALTEFARAKYIEGGLPEDRIAVKPNFLERPSAPAQQPRAGALFVGRLSPEKGVDRLVRAWRQLPDIPLTVAGDGPMRQTLEAEAPENVRFLGLVGSAAVDSEMRRARALIVPSIWYEGFPMTLVEAFANGLPAIVSRIGSLAEIVEPGETGAHCVPGDEASLAATVRAVFADPAGLERMGKRARARFEQSYSAERNLAMLEQIYADASHHLASSR